MNRALRSTTGIALLLSAHSACADLSAGLLAWYPYQGDALDASGSGRHGLPYQLTYVPGHEGQAAWFDGDQSRMGMNLPMSPGDWTICGWAYVEEINSAWTDWQDFVSSHTQAFAVGVDNWDGGKLTLWIGGDTAQDPDPIPLQTPFFWLFEQDGGTCRIWRDGVLVASVTSSFTPGFLRTVGQWIAGASSPMDREPLHGWLDEIRIYNRALDASEKEELLGGGGTVEAHETPVAFGLLRAWPNPFNPSTEISFTLSEPGLVNLRVLDLLGRDLTVLHESMLDRGEHQLRLDAAGWPSGVYICNLEAGGQHQAIKLTLLR